MNILVVEDEALVALLIQEVVEEAGHACVGPAASVGEACALIDSCHVDAALLDIWLKDDEFVYPAARKLASRGIPAELNALTGEFAPCVSPSRNGVSRRVSELRQETGSHTAETQFVSTRA
jgi:CheY-like chemotaxis protein